MGWFRLDGSFWRDPRVVAMTPDAGVLYVMALSFSARERTDGCITHEELRVVLCRLHRLDPSAIDDLIDAGLLEEVHPRTDDSCAVYKLVEIRS